VECPWHDEYPHGTLRGILPDDRFGVSDLVVFFNDTEISKLI
jgi:hypothetical protein